MHFAQSPRVAVVDPAQIVLQVIRVGEAREPQLPAGEREVMIAGDPLLAGVVDADAEQLAVVLVRDVEIVRHGALRIPIRVHVRLERLAVFLDVPLTVVFPDPLRPIGGIGPGIGVPFL